MKLFGKHLLDLKTEDELSEEEVNNVITQVCKTTTFHKVICITLLK